MGSPGNNNSIRRDGVGDHSGGLAFIIRRAIMFSPIPSMISSYSDDLCIPNDPRGSRIEEEIDNSEFATTACC